MRKPNHQISLAVRRALLLGAIASFTLTPAVHSQEQPPSTTTEQPAATTEPPATSAEQPSTSTEQPSTSTGEPSTSTGEPAANAQSGNTTVAQAAATGEQPQQQIETVTVTGTRIATPAERAISPVTTLSGAEVANSGRTSVEDFLNTVPQIFGSQNSSVSNTATGTAYLNLRDLDSKRTLVLVNGRRLGPGDPSSGFARNSYGSDVNMIPPAMIERVDLLTGGASSVYGADAVSGVVNFILNTHFEGIRVTASYGFFNHDNGNAIDSVLASSTPPVTFDSTVNTGFQRDASVIIGVSTPDDKGNATFYATFRSAGPIVQSSYDYSACTLNSGDAFSCGGSSTSGPPYSNGRFNHITNAAMGTTGPSQTIGPGGTLVPFTAANLYNFGALNFFSRPDKRYTAGSFIHYQVNDHIDAYGELMFMRDETRAQIAPSGAFLGGYPFDPNGALTVNCANPFLSAAELTAWCAGSTTGNTQLLIGRRNVEGGPRTQDFTHENFRVVLGARGEIDDVWKYDTYFQYGMVQQTSLFSNDVSWSNIQNALMVVNVNGVPTCQSVITGLDPRCVPWNIFTPGGVTSAATNYLDIPLLQQGTVTEQVFNANFTGDLGKYGVQLPTAHGGLNVNTGFEWRLEKSNFQPDAAYINNLGAGQGGAVLPVSGGYNVREIFFESRLPILEDQFLAQSLTLDAGYRWSDYSLGFRTNTYKFGLEWTPISDFRFRASFQRAVRVPNVGELFSPQQVALDGVTDPCAGMHPVLTMEQCARTGVQPGQFMQIDANPASQYNGFIGGNPNLKPETALTKSFGFTVTPSAIEGLSFTLDYFDINILNAIQNPNPDFTLILCAETGDPNICSRIHRSNNGSLWQSTNAFVEDTLTNIGSILTRGFDVDADYRFEVAPAGRLDVRFIGTYTDTYKVTPQPGASYECAGFFGGICLAPLPKWRHTLTVSWETPVKGLRASVAWRYLDSVDLDAFAPGLSFLAGAYAAGAGTTGAPATDVRLSSRSYFDIAVDYTYDRYTLRVGANNLLDKDPPLNGSTTCPTGPCNGNTWPVIYDATGRFLYAQVSADF